MTIQGSNNTKYSHEPYNFITEHLRWYDYWLKGIDNGIMDEDPLIMYNYGSDEWRTYDDKTFPLNGVKERCYHLQGTPSGTIDAVFDGSMTTRAPQDEKGSMTYEVDYSISKKGFEDRNYYTVPGNPDYTDFDKKSVTFTTAPFAEDTNVVGFPVFKLWISSDTPVIDLYVTLEEIDENGVSTYLSDSKIRTSFRKTHIPAFEHMGLPFHRTFRADDKPMEPDKPYLMDFAGYIMSNTIKAGHSLRLTINNSDKENWITPEITPAPHVTVYFNTEYDSSVVLPVMDK